MCSCPGDNTYFDMPSNSCACTEPGYKFSSHSQCCVISGSGYPSGHERRNKININFSGLGAVELCPQGQTSCPISGALSMHECIDVSHFVERSRESDLAICSLQTATNLESCGGCASTDVGIDCSAIPGVDATACVDGRCQACEYLLYKWTDPEDVSLTLLQGRARPDGCTGHSEADALVLESRDHGRLRRTAFISLGLYPPSFQICESSAGTLRHLQTTHCRVYCRISRRCVAKASKLQGSHTLPSER